MDPKPSFLVELHRADLVLLNGLQLEVGFLPPLLTQCGNGKIQPGAAGYVDLSTFIKPIEVPVGGVDRSTGDVHPFGNPHYHLDPRNMVAIARGLGSVFASADPGHAEDAAKERRGDVSVARSPGRRDHARAGSSARTNRGGIPRHAELFLHPLRPSRSLGS